MHHARLIPKLAWFYAGLTVQSWGIALMIGSGRGAPPWDVFHIGLTRIAPLPLALAVQLTGAAVIAGNWLLGIRPTLGMVLNMLSLGPLVQWNLHLLPAPASAPGGWGMLLGGVLLAGTGIAAYISADLGAGPRDGFMLGLTRRLGLPVGVVRNGMDVAVSLVGYLMGGPLGPGTVAIALTLGASVQLGLRLMRRLSRIPGLQAVVRPPRFQRAA